MAVMNTHIFYILFQVIPSAAVWVISRLLLKIAKRSRMPFRFSQAMQVKIEFFCFSMLFELIEGVGS